MNMITDETFWTMWHWLYSLEIWNEYCEKRLDLTVVLLNRLTEEVASLKQEVVNVKNEMKDMKAMCGDPAWARIHRTVALFVHFCCRPAVDGVLYAGMVDFIYFWENLSFDAMLSSHVVLSLPGIK